MNRYKVPERWEFCGAHRHILQYRRPPVSDDRHRLAGQAETPDLPDGGHFLGIAFHLTDGSTCLCSYLETSQYGRGYFTDGEQRFEVSNLRLLDYWNTFDGEVQPFEDGETAQFPSIWTEE